MDDKAFKRLANLVGIPVKIIMADGEETSGIFDSFKFGNVSFIVLDDSYTGLKKIINFSYIYMITESEEEKK